MVSLDNFDESFDIGVNNVQAMSAPTTKSDIINLCKTKADKNNKYPATLGIASFVPILDRTMNPIHSLSNVMELTVPVPNESYDPNDPNSKKAFWTTFTYIPEENYRCPLTEEEKKALDGLATAMYEYNDAYGKYDLGKKSLYFMKAFLIRIKSDSAGPIYTDYQEPVVLRHTSNAFPSAYSSLIKDTDDTRGSKEWRRAVFLPDGEIRNFITCTTRNKPNGAIGYNVTCGVINDASTGKAVSREKLKEWMDFDINTIGFDTSKFDVHGVRYMTDQIYAALDYMDSQSVDEEPINGNAQASSAPTTATAPVQPTENVAPTQSAPSFDSMQPVGTSNSSAEF